MKKISAAIGYIIFGGSVLSYVSALMRQPFEKVSTVGLSAFALVAAVSGLCFAMAQVLEKENDKSTALYSGEKLLHSAVLILETIVLKYASDAVLSSTFCEIIQNTRYSYFLGVTWDALYHFFIRSLLLAIRV